MLDRWLEDLEDRIDEGTEDRLHAEWRAFCDGEFRGDIFCPQRPAAPPRIPWPSIRVNEALNDFDKMALQQFRTCSDMLERGSGGLLCIRSNYGTGIIPSLFGAELFVMDDETNTLPTTRPLGGADAIRRALDAGIPDLARSLGGKVLDMAERFEAIRAKYPKIRRYVHHYHPDLQGPMDLCELLWGSGLFLDLVDQPNLVKAMLELLTETYAAFLRRWLRIVPFEQGYQAHWQMLHKGCIMLRDDSAMNLAPAMFDEFVRPYDERLLAEFGGGAVHFCGRGDHYIDRLPKMRGVFAVAMSQPEYNNMETIFRHTVDRGIHLLGLRRDTAEAALAAGRNLHGRVHCAERATRQPKAGEAGRR